MSFKIGGHRDNFEINQPVGSQPKPALNQKDQAAHQVGTHTLSGKSLEKASKILGESKAILLDPDPQTTKIFNALERSGFI